MEIHGSKVAAVVLEPVMGNAGVIPPEPGFLELVRQTTTECGSLLVFDEVITGLRLAAGGGQEYYAVRPDITVLSKALGCGFPVAAFGASRTIMDAIVQGRLFHGGVYSGNALVMAAADAVLDELLARGSAIYGHLYQVTQMLAEGINDVFTSMNIPHLVQHVGPMLSLFLTRRPVEKLIEYREVSAECDFKRYIQFQHELQRTGVYFHPNQFEPMFLSTAHQPADIMAVLESMERGAQKCLT
jgi:glutamate-1-semialdehyde 2,1-aminomutase